MLVFRVTVTGVLSGQFVQSVFHFRGDPVSGGTPFQETINLLTHLSDAWLVAFLEALPVDYTVTSLRAQAIPPIAAPTAIMLPPAFVGGESVGQRAGHISSSQVNPLIQWLNNDEPTNTGRTFMPGVSETDIDQMVISAGLFGALTAFVAEHVGAEATGFGWDRIAVMHVRGSGPPGSNFDLTDGQVTPLIGTQRRRLHPI